MINSIVHYIKEHIFPRTPTTLIILGSGLGSLGEKLENSISINYKDIPHFPQSTVKGHESRLICGRLGNKEVLCMQGRFHLYEGHSPQTINQLFQIYKLLGIKELIVTNAAGSLNPNIPPGSLMLINDHINFSGKNPLIGPDDESFGPRFPDMSNAYDKNTRQLIHTIAQQQNLELHEGTYLMVLGPNFETPAEIRAFRILGADAVGMSTVPEVISAVHAGMKVLGISVITNFGTGMQQGTQSHEETLSQGQNASTKLIQLVTAYLKETSHG